MPLAKGWGVGQPYNDRSALNFRAKVPHKSSAARTSCLPRAQVVCWPHRMPGRPHKSPDPLTESRDARTGS